MTGTPTALPLLAQAPAKINLGLFLGPTRRDGRHELASVMQSVSLVDELTLEWAPRGAARDELCCPNAPELERRNLAERALAAFRERFGWRAPPLRLTLLKRVPVAAGLGGGSGDAAAALRLAAVASGLGDREGMLGLAAELGADVPAQVEPGRWLALGAGERLRALPAPGRPFGVLVLALDHTLSTAAVYAEADRLGLARDADELSRQAGALELALRGGEPLPAAELLANDLQAAAVSLCPAIEPALALALQAGADVSLVSGSGPTVLGLFAGADGPGRARRAAGALTGSGPPRALAGRWPRAFAAEPVQADFAAVRAVRNN